LQQSVSVLILTAKGVVPVEHKANQTHTAMPRLARLVNIGPSPSQISSISRVTVCCMADSLAYADVLVIRVCDPLNTLMQINSENPELSTVPSLS
jgi:hypothetical protein